MLPRVKINFKNGSLGGVSLSADGELGLLALGSVKEGSFDLEKAYSIRSLAEVEELGVSENTNALLYRNIKDFYNEAGDGTKLWLMGFDETRTLADVLDKDSKKACAKTLLLEAKGAIRGLVAFKKSNTTLKMEAGLDSDVYAAILKAQGLGDYATSELYAPIFTLLEGFAFNGKAGDLKDLRKQENNRVGVVIGDTLPSSKNAAMGVVAGKVAKAPVQEKISRVKSGALTVGQFYVGDRSIEQADIETLYDKGYITFRGFVGKSGCYIAGDNMATKPSDDYNSLANRRVIDKAYRQAYDVLVNTIDDEVPLTAAGTLSPAWTSVLESDVEKRIISTMTSQGNLGNDPADSADMGVRCFISSEQNILSNKCLAVSLSVKPKGYASYINVDLGFKTK